MDLRVIPIRLLGTAVFLQCLVHLLLIVGRLHKGVAPQFMGLRLVVRHCGARNGFVAILQHVIELMHMQVGRGHSHITDIAFLVLQFIGCFQIGNSLFEVPRLKLRQPMIDLLFEPTRFSSHQWDRH